MENLTRKKNVRAAHRASATRIMNQTTTALVATPVNLDDLELLKTGLTSGAHY